MDSPTRPRHEENHPLPWDGVVKESEGGGRFVQLCREEEEEDGRWPDGGWSGMEWSSSREHTCTTSVERVPLKADEAREVACKSLAYVDRAGEVQKSKSLANVTKVWSPSGRVVVVVFTAVLGRERGGLDLRALQYDSQHE